MEDVPVIVFVLLFFLVLILILLHKSNKKYADKISVLEQTVELKAESLSSMKEIYAESKKVLAKSKAQQEDIESKKKVILTLKETKYKLEDTIRKQAKEQEQQKRLHEDVINEVTAKIVALELYSKHQYLGKRLIQGLKLFLEPYLIVHSSSMNMKYQKS